MVPVVMARRESHSDIDNTWTELTTPRAAGFHPSRDTPPEPVGFRLCSRMGLVLPNIWERESHSGAKLPDWRATSPQIPGGVWPELAGFGNSKAPAEWPAL